MVNHLKIITYAGLQTTIKKQYESPKQMNCIPKGDFREFKGLEQ